MVQMELMVVLEAVVVEIIKLIMVILVLLVKVVMEMPTSTLVEAEEVPLMEMEIILQT